MRIEITGGQEFASWITNEAADELGLKPGGRAYAVIKPLDVRVAVD